MTFLEYICEHGVPGRVICIDTYTRYMEIPKERFHLPLITGMVVDHIESPVQISGDTIVFLRCPDGINAV